MDVRNEHPLTLLKIMIVIFLIGFISTIIGFNIKGFLDKAKLFKREKSTLPNKKSFYMNIPLPNFRYHPDPLSTGSIISSEESCECCGEARGCVINAPIYCVEEVESLCPWCVADGSASKKFDGIFVDSDSFEKNEISESIVEEVTKRTPGFSGLQHERWLTHCLDACQYQGLASIEEIKQLSREEVLQAVDDGRFYSYCRDDNYWKELFDVYQGNRSVSFYKFSCLHCKKLLYYMDALYTFALRDFES